MTQVTPSEVVRKEVPRSLERDFKFLGLCVLLSTVLVIAVAIANPSANADELAATVAVPLVGFYILARLMGAFIPKPTEEEIAQLREWRQAYGLRRAAFVFAAIFSIMAVLVPVILFSALAYSWLEMTWAIGTAVNVLGITLILGALSSVLTITCSLLHHNQTTFRTFWHSIFRLSTSDLRLETERIRMLFRSTLAS
jgi:uncharacterized membrane protein